MPYDGAETALQNPLQISVSGPTRRAKRYKEEHMHRHLAKGALSGKQRPSYSYLALT